MIASAPPTKEELPCHVAIVMDGNGRWANNRMMPRAAGHVAGVSTVRAIVRAAHEMRLQNLTLYAFSSENWKRPVTEVSHLMALFRAYVRDDVSELVKNNARLRFIGNRSRASADILSLIEESEKRTEANTGLNLTLAFDYSSQEEIVSAAREMARAAAQGELDPDKIDIELFSTKLSTAGTPDPDLVIRTSGEYRLSNFLLWQSAYSEFVFVDKMWPDFTREDFYAALQTYARRERRFGAVVAESAASA
jgi:undecaprenyl diphosphate synthase